MIGKNITILRKARKKSQTDLGEYLGISQSAVSQLERGITNVDVETATRIATYFGVSVGELVGDDPSFLSGVKVMPPKASSSPQPIPSVTVTLKGEDGVEHLLMHEVAHYVGPTDRQAKIAEAAEILQSMTDEEYKMALNVLRAMKK